MQVPARSRTNQGWPQISGPKAPSVHDVAAGNTLERVEISPKSAESLANRSDPDHPKICVYGAGNVGCYIGGRLQATGTPVQFVGRASMGQTLHQHGLHLTDFRGADLSVRPQEVNFSDDPTAASAADVVLVTVKSGGTDAAAAELSHVVKPGSVVVSLQNGVTNVDSLRRQLPGCTVLAGMVPFNVTQQGGGKFHQGTSGGIVVEQNPALNEVSNAFAQAGLPLESRTDLPAVQWSKLLMNLNNSVNALSSLPLKTELSQRDYRRCLAMAQKEALQVLDKASIRPARLTLLPTHWIPPMLGLPNFIFSWIASSLLAIDPLARSSMQDDLEKGRKTEIDWINGAVVDLAKTVHEDTPVNNALIRLIHDAEQGGRRDWSGPELLAVLR
jgi:2-dehydropantoate 2-reductase